MRRSIMHGRLVNVVSSSICNVFIVNDIRITYKRELATRYIHNIATYWVRLRIFIKKFIFGEL